MTVKTRSEEATPSKSSHEAELTQVAVHFTLTTHLHRDVDLKSAVRRLLGADIAVSAAWPSERGIRVTPRMRKFARLLGRMQRLRDHFEEFQQARSLGAAAKFVSKHPVFFLRNVGRRNSEEAVATAVKEDGLASLDEALEVGIGVLIDSQKISAVEREIDAQLFGGASRDFDDFVRLNLRGSYHDVRIPGTDETFYVVLEPRLLLHKSGAIQLTIAVPIEPAITTSQLIELSRSDQAMAVKSRIPEPLVAYRDEGKWGDELDSGARLRERASEEGWAIADLLQEHLQAAIGALARFQSRGKWNIHATVFGAPGTCCSNTSTWRDRHDADISRISTRHNTTRAIDHKRLAGINLAIESDSFLSTNLGSTTRLDFDSKERAPFDELNTVLLVEHVMLQYCRLQNIEHRVSRPRLYGSKLRWLQQDAIAVFTDMRQHELRFGSAREIATHLLGDLGAKEMRHTIETALNLASQANATHEAGEQARRSMTLTWVATVLAVLVAIPALTQLLELAAAVDTGTTLAWLLTPFRWLAGLGGWGPWLIVLGLIAAVFLWWLFGKLWWAARFVWLVIKVIAGRRGPLVPEQFTLKAELRNEEAPSELEASKGGAE